MRHMAAFHPPWSALLSALGAGRRLAGHHDAHRGADARRRFDRDAASQHAGDDVVDDVHAKSLTALAILVVKKGSKTWRSTSSGMPTPSSANTSSSRPSPNSAARIVTTPASRPSKAWVSALLIRLFSTWYQLPGYESSAMPCGICIRTVQLARRSRGM